MSWIAFWWTCKISAWCLVLGSIKSRVDHGNLPIRNLPGELLMGRLMVNAWLSSKGVIRYLKRKLVSCVCNGRIWCFLYCILKSIVLLSLPSHLKQAGKGCLNMANIPRDDMNKANCVLVKAGLLSMTLMSGNPWVANREQSLSMVASVVGRVSSTSNHFEWASTITRNVLPPKHWPGKILV